MVHLLSYLTTLNVTKIYKVLCNKIHAVKNLKSYALSPICTYAYTYRILILLDKNI